MCIIIRNNSHNKDHKFTRTRYSKNKTSNRSIDLYVLQEACHELIYVFGAFYASGTREAEVTKSPPFSVEGWDKSSIRVSRGLNLRAKYCLGGWGRFRQLSYIIVDCQKLVDIRAIWVCRGHTSKPASVVANKCAIQFLIF